MLIHQLPLDAAFEALRSTPTGLSAQEAAVAAARVRAEPDRTTAAEYRCIVRFLAQFTHFFAGLLWVAALLAFILDMHVPGQGMGTLALAILAVILINGGFAFWQEYRAEETMAALQRLLPHQVRALRDRATARDPIRRAGARRRDLPQCRRRRAGRLPAARGLWGPRELRDAHRGGAAGLARRSARNQGGPAPKPQRPAGGNLNDRRRSKGAGLLDRDAHGVRANRPPDADDRRTCRRHCRRKSRRSVG